MSAPAKPASSRRSVAAPRTSPCAHGQALIPNASTPTTRRTLVGDAAAIPISVAISCVGSPVTGVRRASGYCARICTSARSASCRRTTWRRDVLGERLDQERLADHDLVDGLPEDLREARHVDALLGGIEVDGARDLGREGLLVPLVPDPDRLLDARHAGPGQADPHLGRRGLQITDNLAAGPRHRVERYAMTDEQRFSRIVSLACHDLRTPLATVYGFARTLERGGELDERSLRFVTMISQASEQMTSLLDELGVAARIEGGRFEPGLVEADTVALATSDDERIATGGSGETIETEPAAGRAWPRGARDRGDPLRPGRAGDVVGRRALARAQPRSIEAAAPVVLGDEVRDLGSLVARIVIEQLGGSLALDGETLRVQL